MVVTMLTTTDNPYNPFEQFEKWYAYDERHGYHTCGYIDRICKGSNELSPSDKLYAVNEAIEEILKLNITGNYKKVTKEV